MKVVQNEMRIVEFLYLKNQIKISRFVFNLFLDKSGTKHAYVG